MKEKINHNLAFDGRAVYCTRCSFYAEGDEIDIIIPPSPADSDQRALILMGEAFLDDDGRWRFRQDALPWNYARDLSAALCAAADEAETKAVFCYLRKET